MERLNLYPHNNDSSKRIIDAFNNGENVVGIVHATGTGKTFNALSLCLENKDKKIVYLVPSKAVSEHIKKVIESNPNLSLERDFPNLEFRTYQSLCNLSTKELEDINADYLILDEFHHIGAPIWGDRVNTIIETHPNIKVFGMTAYTVRDRGTAYERDMANPEGKELFSKKIVSTYDLPDAMIDGVLPLPIYRSAYTQLQGMAQELEERVLNGNVSKEEKERYIELLDAVKRRIAEAPSIKDVIIRNLKKDGKYIYFCPPGATEGVNDIETIKKEVLSWLKDFVNEEDIVFYQTTSELGEIGIENRECFYNDTDSEGKSTDGKLRIMFAINQYNEGVHAPNIDGVILGRGTSSDIVYFEQIGRALSVRGNTYEEFNKYMEYSIYELREIAQKRNIDTSKLQTKEEIIEKLIAPVIIDLANNISFIKELENNLKDRIKQVRETKTNQERRIRLIPEVSFDIEVLNEELFDVLMDLRERLGYLSWEDSYKLAKAYYKKNGHLKIPDDYTIEAKNGKIVKLGVWIRNQRSSKAANRLDEERIRLLENIGMVWNVFEDEWMQKYNLAKEYYLKNGDLNITVEYIIQNKLGEKVKLGKWIIEQRKAYKNESLDETRKQLLENIGMVWDVYEKEWLENYELAKEYYLKNNNLYIPARYITQNKLGENVKLGQWIMLQRRAKASNSLSQLRIQLLEEIGMVWNMLELAWLMKYEKTVEYYHSVGDINQCGDVVLTDKDGNDFKLNEWIIEQRKAYKNESLDETRKQLLESIGIKWNLYDEIWYEKYKLAVKYYEMKGNLKAKDGTMITNDLGEEINIGGWIIMQRRAYKKGSLSQDKIQLLENIGMKWKTINRKTKDDTKSICEEYGLDCEKYPDLLKIPYEVLLAKINYLNSNNVPLMDNNELNPIFFMSDVNMQVMYGISLEDLVKQYSNSNKKGGK